jgi:hypothetical protein
MPYAPINFAAKFARFSEHWSPKIVAQMNDYHFKLVRGSCPLAFWDRLW